MIDSSDSIVIVRPTRMDGNWMVLCGDAIAAKFDDREDADWCAETIRITINNAINAANVWERRGIIALAKALQIINHAGNMDGDVETVKRYLRNGMRSLDPTQPKTENRP